MKLKQWVYDLMENTFGIPNPTKKENRLPPWVTHTYAGGLKINKKDKRYQAWFKDYLKYHSQYDIVDGQLELTNDKGLNRPKQKDYYE